MELVSTLRRGAVRHLHLRLPDCLRALTSTCSAVGVPAPHLISRSHCGLRAAVYPQELISCPPTSPASPAAPPASTPQPSPARPHCRREPRNPWPTPPPHGLR